MKQQRKILSTMLMVMLALPAMAQELLTLEDAVALALKNNHQVQLVRNLSEIEQNKANPGNANFLPKIDLTSSVSYSDAVTQSSFGPVEMELTQGVAQLEATYNIFSGFGDYFTYRRLKLNSANAELSARNGIENTILQVYAAYFGAVGALDEFAIAQEALFISHERYQRAKNKADYGQANRLDLLNAQVDLNADSISFLNAHQKQTEAYENLILILGTPSGSDFYVNNEVAYSKVASEEEMLASGLKYNSDYLMAVNNLKGSEIDLKSSRALHFPRLDLRTTYGYNQYTSGMELQYDEPNRNLSAGITMNLNLFDGFKRSIQRQNAKIVVRNQSIQEDLAKRNLEKELKTAYSNLKNTHAIHDMSLKNLQSAELNFQRTKELFEAGQLTNTQFREAQLNLVRSKAGLSQAKYSTKLAEVKLMQLSGQLLKEK